MQPAIDMTFDRTLPIGSQVYAFLRKSIIQTHIIPGSKLSESELATKLGVSRQPIREALIRLDNDGLLEIRPQRGTFVKRISQKHVLDVRFVREAIESDIAVDLAMTADKKVIAKLQELIEEQKRVPEDCHIEFMELDEAFHFALAESAGKSYAWNIVQSVKAQMDRVRFLSFADFSMTTLIPQHQAIVDAIAQGDSSLASQAMRTHLQEILKTLPSIAAKHTELFDV